MQVAQSIFQDRSFLAKIMRIWRLLCTQYLAIVSRVDTMARVLQLHIDKRYSRIVCMAFLL